MQIWGFGVDQNRGLGDSWDCAEKGPAKRDPGYLKAVSDRQVCERPLPAPARRPVLTDRHGRPGDPAATGDEDAACILLTKGSLLRCGNDDEPALFNAYHAGSTGGNEVNFHT